MFKKIISLISLISGITLGVVGIILPPLGEIDNSVLIIVGQLLIYSSAVIGIKLKD